MFFIAICYQWGDKWQSKSLFLLIFDLRSLIVLTFSIAGLFVQQDKCLSYFMYCFISHIGACLSQCVYRLLTIVTMTPTGVLWLSSCLSIELEIKGPWFELFQRHGVVSFSKSPPPPLPVPNITVKVLTGT